MFVHAKELMLPENTPRPSSHSHLGAIQHLQLETVRPRDFDDIGQRSCGSGRRIHYRASIAEGVRRRSDLSWQGILMGLSIVSQDKLIVAAGACRTRGVSARG